MLAIKKMEKMWITVKACWKIILIQKENKLNFLEMERNILVVNMKMNQRRFLK